MSPDNLTGGDTFCDGYCSFTDDGEASEVNISRKKHPLGT
jgi:hypothetical protein